ncbi:MAG: GNAT family N-acetyltransferase [Polaribacter sp.]|nr:GNAT family N-acetyltransferase [Polaribacter sp.]
MITIHKKIQLQPILPNDIAVLQELMWDIYPPAYSHFWKDDGVFYIHNQYSKENILIELSQENTQYYFVVFNNEIIGNFRVVWNEKLTGLSQEKQLKLHRLYLHPKTQNKGVGKIIISWLEAQASFKDYEILWLDAMEKQEQSFQFYKKRGYKYHAHVFLEFNLMHGSFRKMNQVYKVLGSL